MPQAQLAKQASSDRSKEIVDAFQSALSASLALGCSKRSVLHGLWIFLVAMLVENTQDRDDRCSMLESLCSEALGTGFNSESVLESLDEASRQGRIVQGRTVSQTLVARLDDFIADDEDGEGSRLVFEHGMDMLLRSWGPVHFRRILAEQADAFAEGLDVPIFPVEPHRLNKEKKVQAPSQIVREAEIVVLAPSKPRFERRMVEMCVDADLEEGHAVYAVVSEITSSGGRRRENHETCVRTDDPNGRIPYLAALSDALSSLGPERASVRMETPSILLLDGFGGDRSSRTVFPGESDIWAEIDALVAAHDVEWVYLSNVLQSRLGERCDRILRIEKDRN
jgi:hypothetical protein